jgi:hypothetical protein
VDIHKGSGQDPQTNAQLCHGWAWVSLEKEGFREERVWMGSSEGVEKALDELVEIEIGAAQGLDLSD